jgi:asparagine synthase (glutamine-hydrolysing)
MGNASLASSFARKINLPARRSSFRHLHPVSRPSSREYRFENILHPHNAAARERYDRVAAPLGIEPRDPFMDRRVIDFSLSLPASQIQSAQWPKLVLRRAMGDLTPSLVRWRATKEHVGFLFTRAVIKDEVKVKNLPRLAPLLRPYVSQATLSKIDELAGAMDMDTYVELFGLASWLERNAHQGVQRSLGE